MPQDNLMLDAALAYQAKGWKVFPLKPGTKQPATKNGYKDASVERLTAELWWTADPRRGIGLALADSGLLAVDVDPRNGGPATLENAEFLNGEIPRDCVQKTGRGDGGHHIVLRAREGARYPGQLGPGVDLKHHGYIVLAPSLHPDTGAPYKWERCDAPPEAPAWLESKQADAAATQRPAGDTAAVTDEQWTEVCDAIYKLDADVSYPDWIAIGMALKSTGHPDAQELWEDWSKGGNKWQDGGCDAKWRTLGGAIAGGVDYRLILKRAMEAGWRTPIRHHFDDWVEPDPVGHIGPLKPDNASQETLSGQTVAPALPTPSAQTGLSSPGLTPAKTVATPLKTSPEVVPGLVDEEVEETDPEIDWGAWQDRPIPPRDWLVEGRVGLGHVTALYGRGGIGKSRLAMQLACCVALGKPFLDTPTMKGRAMGLFCEDDERELVERQAYMATALGFELEDLKGRFITQPRPGLSNRLVETDPRSGRVVVTKLYQRVERRLADGRKSGDPILFLAIDNIGQMMGVNEINRREVTEGLNLIQHLAHAYHAAVFLLGHPAKADGSTQSGSTAWDACVRARLYFGRGKDEMGRERGPLAKQLELTQEKGNYAGDVMPLDLAFQGGIYVRLDQGPAFRARQSAESARLRVAFDTLVAGLRELRRLGVEDPSHQRTSPTRYLPKLMSQFAVCGDCTEKELSEALPHAITTGIILIKTTKDGHRARLKTWIEPAEEDDGVE